MASQVAAQLPIRLGARVIDVVVVGGLAVGLGQLMGFGYDWLVTGAALILAYFVLLDVFAGATLGKRVLGLRVVGPDGGRPTLRQAFTREVFTVFGAIPFVGPLLALAAWIWIIVTMRASPTLQGKHDVLAGGTRVVHNA